ncbi:transcription termination/antitermination protein NusG [Azospirillum brasilense]|uniref:transcription termination/antitermination protein NusG n=1 Tax=Azospirillum brasilense TaxID=192 RepID=UPI00157A7FF3|nr:transcription termination/antitermination NusG family protein [Azospirillum brasilense]
MDMFSDREWFAVVVKPGRNQEVHRRFEEQGYRSFLPLCLRERSNGPGRVETVVRPLFDRYQFVGCHTEQPFSPITSTIGVNFVVRGVGNFPLRVSPLVLRKVKDRCDADGGAVDFRPRQSEPRPPVTWEPEQVLRVIEGPFRDFAAVFLEVDKRREMALVMVDLFGRSTPLAIPVDSLRPDVTLARRIA